MNKFKQGMLLIFFGFYLYISALIVREYLDSLVMEMVIGSTLIGMLVFTMNSVFNDYSKKKLFVMRLLVSSIFLVFIFVDYIIVG